MFERWPAQRWVKMKNLTPNHICDPNQFYSNLSLGSEIPVLWYSRIFKKLVSMHPSPHTNPWKQSLIQSVYEYLGKQIDNALCSVIVSYFKTNQPPKPASPSAQGASCMTKTPSPCSDMIHQEILDLEMTAVATSDCSQIRERQGKKGTHHQPEWRRSHWAAQASCQTQCKCEVSLSGELTKKTGQQWTNNSFRMRTTSWRVKGSRAAFDFSFQKKELYWVSWGEMNILTS